MDTVKSSVATVTKTLDSDNSKEYEYQPLDSTACDIRILTIQPIQNLESELELTISHAYLCKSSYCALSYTWGDAKDQKTVRLNGQKFQLNANLEEALRAVASYYGTPFRI